MNIKSLDLDGVDGSPIGRRTYDAIAQSIVTGQLEPGASLSDRQVADALGVSRTPVRDAFHRLTYSGLVERRGRTGWFVTEFGVENIREIYQAREIIEPAGLATMDSWEPDMFAALQRFQDFYGCAPSETALAENLAMDHEFHRFLVTSSRNSLLVTFYETVNLQIERVRHFVPVKDSSRLDESFAEHRAILASILEGDGAGAAHAVKNHIQSARDALLRLL